MNESIPIFLLHGLGANTLTLLPLEKYLNHCGFTNTCCLSYPVDTMSLEESVDYVDKLISEKVDKENEEIVLIGQSMGGVVLNNLHHKGWNIKKAIYIGSPLHGANLLNQLENMLPTKIRDFFYKKPYGILQNKEREQEPPHPYHTISMGWFNTYFDGCVYQNETILDEKNHTHLSWADHRTIFLNPRLWVHVSQLLV